MRLREWVRTGVLVVVATAGCGGRTALLTDDETGGPVDGSADGDDGALPDGAPTDERGPTPVPVCSGRLSQCLAPDAGIVSFGAAIIQCDPEEYVGPWTLVLERLIGNNWQMVQTQVVEEPGFGATFYDSSGPPTVLTYRVCAIANSTTALCGTSFVTQGPPDCTCLPTSCALNTACNVMFEDACGGTTVCGACDNGLLCNAYHSCCPGGFMSDGNGGCVCAPPLPGSPGGPCPAFRWNPITCTCAP
jgi:hypothetical protein